jgi:hypothetical protein
VAVIAVLLPAPMPRLEVVAALAELLDVGRGAQVA